MRERSCVAAAAVGRLAAGVAIAATFASAGALFGAAITGSSQVAGASPLAANHRCSAGPVSGTAQLKLKVERSSAGKVPTIAVCIDGKGPYPFAVSTGAGASVVTPGLARTLHLRKGAGVSVRGVTCVTSAPSATVSSWSMSGETLAPQSLLVAKVAAAGIRPAPKGIIGSDVLSRFGAVRIDYHKSRLFLLGSEGAASKRNVYIPGGSNALPPAALAKGSIKLNAALRVFESPEGTIVAAPVRIAGHTEQLAVDSGSPGSGLAPDIRSALKLSAAKDKVPYSGIGCKGKAATYSSGPWTLGGTALANASLAARPITGGINSGLQGVLGANVLAADGAVIVDYNVAHLWLTTG